LFQGADGLRVIVEDGGGKSGVGCAGDEDFGEMLRRFCAAAGDDWHRDGSGNGVSESNVESGLCAVAVHAGEEDFAGAELHGEFRPVEGIETS